MTVIALWALIVISDDALTTATEKQPILVRVRTTLDRFRYLPDHHLHYRAVVEIEPVALQQGGLHVGNHANDVRPLSNAPTESFWTASWACPPRGQRLGLDLGCVALPEKLELPTAWFVASLAATSD